MKREVTFIDCNQCKAELFRSDHDAVPYWKRDYWQWDDKLTFCGEVCARAYFDAEVTAEVESRAAKAVRDAEEAAAKQDVIAAAVRTGTEALHSKDFAPEFKLSDAVTND